MNALTCTDFHHVWAIFGPLVDKNTQSWFIHSVGCTTYWVPVSPEWGPVVNNVLLIIWNHSPNLQYIIFVKIKSVGNTSTWCMALTRSMTTTAILTSFILTLRSLYMLNCVEGTKICICIIYHLVILRWNKELELLSDECVNRGWGITPRHYLNQCNQTSQSRPCNVFAHILQGPVSI